MYEFCVEEGIDDIERFELEQIKKLETIVARKVANVEKNSMQIVDNSRKEILFMSGKKFTGMQMSGIWKGFNFCTRACKFKQSCAATQFLRSDE